MSDSLEGMPEFGKPSEEIVPLVVPDTTPFRSPHLCNGLSKAGKPCGFPHQKDRLFCIQHDPAIPEEKRHEWKRKPRKPRLVPMGEQAHAKHEFFSREEVLEILTRRMKVWMRDFGDVMQPGVDDAICNLAKAYAVVAKVELGNEVEEVKGWRMKGAV